jgi:beta-N-acetylhexosaminidase
MLSKSPNLLDPIWTSLVSAMKDDPVFRARVRDACRRILAVKFEYLRGEKSVPYIPDLAKLETELPNPEGAAFFQDLAARSVTVVRGGTGAGGSAVIPLKPEDAGKVLLAGQYIDFFTLGRAAYPGASAYWYSASQGTAEFTAMARNADTVIFCLSNTEGLAFLRILQSLKKKVIVFSVLSPVYLESVPWADGAIAVYSYARESFAAGFSAILGRIPAGGRLP